MDLIKYVLSELEQNRLSKTDALDLLNQVGGERLNGRAVIHPLLHLNISDFSGQRFSCILTGEELFLRDHLVKGQRILPVAAYLEMARVAVEESCGFTARDAGDGQPTFRARFEDVIWFQPAQVQGGEFELQIGLDVDEHGEVEFEIYSQAAKGEGVADEERVIHCRGRAEIVESGEAARIDLGAIQEQCGGEVIEGRRCYDVFNATGIEYGPAFQSVEKVHVGEGQVLVKLKLPEELVKTQSQYALHPSMLDGALQGCAALMLSERGDREGAKAALLFSMEEIEVSGDCVDEMWAWVRVSAESGERVRKFDVDVCNEKGEVCVSLRGVSSRTLEWKGESAEGLEEGEMAVSLAPVWEVVRAEMDETRPEAGAGVLIVGGEGEAESELKRRYPQARLLRRVGSIEEIVEELKEAGKIEHVIWLAPERERGGGDEERMIEGQEEGALGCFRVIKAMLKMGYGRSEMWFTAITVKAQAIEKSEEIDATDASVHGLMGSLAKEYPKWKVRVVDVERMSGAPWGEILRLPADSQGNGWCYREGEWYRQALIPYERERGEERGYREGGVYVVIGGAGGIGEVFSEYVISEYKARVIWIGRREEDEEIESKRRRLGEKGPEPEYIRGDATNREELESAYQEIKRRHGQVNGVIHSAVGIFDESLEKVEEERFREILKVKVDASVRIAQVFASEPLDFALFFSSMASFSKEAGKAGYSAGCAFKDAYAHQLGQSSRYATKVMNWGWWGEIGIAAIVPQTMKNLLAITGIGSIQCQEGMDALENLLTGPFDQLGLIKIKRSQAAKGAGLAPQQILVLRPKLPALSETLAALPLQTPVMELVHLPRPESYKSFDAHLGILLLSQLRAVGLGEKRYGSVREWWTAVGGAEQYGRWLEESLRELRRRGHLEVEGEDCEVGAKALEESREAWARWNEEKERWSEDENLRAQVRLVDATLRALPEILTGKIAATEIMFPRSSMELVEGIYKNNRIADCFNEELSERLVSYVDERLKLDREARIRILEIGAGTGGTSAKIFEKLSSYREQMEEYRYTNLSKGFLLHAEEKYGKDAPYLKYGILDAERGLAEQEIEVGSYDVVIAANVLHATKNIRETLRNVKTALKKNGLLLLNEMYGKSLLSHLTFGLLDGWWMYEDEALRLEGSPGLSPKSWRRVLEQEGFRGVSFPAAAAHELGLQIIMAESDGVIRQRLKMSSEAAAPARREAERERAVARGGSRRAESLRGRPSAQVELAAPGTGSATAAEEQLLREKSAAYLKKLVGKTLKIDVNLIDAGEPLERYGINSILVVQLTDALKEVIPSVSSTVFFECQSIEGLVEYFLNKERELLRKLVGFQEQIKAVNGSGAKLGADRPAKVTLRDVRGGGHRTKLRSPERAPRSSAGREIAIIGLSGRYPQASNVEQYWENLRAGKNCIVEIPPERWSLEGFYCEDLEQAISTGRSYCKWGGFVDGFADFDPLFFNISPREAEGMDPQERLFMQSCWEVMEDAGYTRETLASRHGGRVGVFAGITKTGFDLYGPEFWRRGEAAFPRTSFSSVANRVSYFMNLNGPSLPIDTMCSASLTAIHEACEHLLRDECELAIAGGVNLYLHPSNFVMLCSGRMLSPSGQCRTFGSGADGMAPGEGVGTVLLKRLSQAEADGDHIYGVIKGSSINHGGKTNGYTVPNPTAQKEVIRGAISRAGVDARAISYIEAHGTGTELGDPIEIAGLTQAFREYTTDQQFCAIGSAKSNIGHCESAAGIAGLTKVLMQMKYGQLAPSLHTEDLNPNIDFEKTPFVVQRELGEWKRPRITVAGGTRERPRMAGISSFGAGGANAHVIVEEYIDRRRGATAGVIDAFRPAVIALSAKTEDRLRVRANQLLSAIDDRGFSDTDLPSIAYTLQVGREAMEHRLAFTVSSLRELREKLTRFTAGDESIDEFYRGEVKQNKKALALFTADDDLQKAIDAWVEKKKYGKLLDFWVRGLAIDWNRLYEQPRPRRISLPSYPFARERYWIPRAGLTGAASIAMAGGGSSALHPLLHLNISDFDGQRFSCTLTGEEFFLRDHVVGGRRILPGVAYLEMARAAMEESCGFTAHDAGDGQPTFRARFEDVIWFQPAQVQGGEFELQIGLDVDEHGEVEFEIYSQAAKGEGVADEERVIHCRGRAEIVESGEAARIDLGAIQEQCGGEVIEGRRCYDVFNATGIEYGPAFQSVEKVHVGEGQVLVKLKLPEELVKTQSQYALHPSMLDGALQGCAALMLSERGDREGAKAALLFSMEEIEVSGDCVDEMWAWVRVSAESGERVRKFDVDVCNEKGEVCVSLRGVSSRTLEWKGESAEGLEEGEMAVSLAPVWEVVRAEMDETRPEAGAGVLIVGGEGEAESELKRRYPQARLLRRVGSIEEIVEELKEAGKIEHVIWLAPERERGGGDEERMIEGQEEGALGCFRVIKAMLKMGYGRSEMWFTAITVKAQAIEKSEEIDATDASVHGLMGSLAKEYPKWKVRVVDVERMSGAPWGEILRLPADSQGNGWCYREGEWYRQALIPYERERGEERGYREGGVYVVIGGAGGIGEVFSEYVISEYKARVIWIGRREEDEEIESKRRRLGEKGPEPEYIRGDATNREELESAYQEIKRRHGQVNGVIHSAVGIFDESLEKVEEERFREILKAKVDAGVRIAQVFAGEPLDFALFFSGMTSFSKEAGKAGYSAGCAFKDAYAHQLGQSSRYATKVMNWGWWGEVGAAGVVPKAYRYRVLLAGIGVIEAGEAMEALEALLAGPLDQLGLIKAAKSQLRQWITPSPQQISTVAQRVPSVIENLLSRESSAFSAINYENVSGESFKALDANLGILLLSQLRAVGLGENRYGSVREWWTAVGGAEQYGRWLEESLRELRRRGHLEIEGEDYEAPAKAIEESREAWTRWNEEKESWLEDENLRAQVRLVEATLRALPEILTGKIAATEIMFPRSSMELVEGIYKNNRVADCFNNELSERLVGYVDERLKLDREARIRMLEIGAGTGGTSAKIFEKLSSYREQIEEYRYTDLSKGFLLHAEEKYGKDAPYLKYGILNVERGLAEQGIEVGSYDVVIAANVLHATKNIRETLRNVKTALKKNGLLLLNEMYGKSLLSHLTFGLLDGWWMYEDEALRVEGSPGLSPERWKRVLEQEGFRGVKFPAAAAHQLGLQIIMAESDGVIRQRLKMSSEAAAPARREAERDRTVARVGSRPAQSLGSTPSAQAVRAVSVTGSATNAEEQLLREKSAVYLKKLIGKTLKIDVNLIDAGEPLERYGVDSIVVVQLTDALREAIPDVSSTIFFECQNIERLVERLITNEREALLKLVGLNGAALQHPAPSAEHKADRQARVAALQGAGRRRRQMVARSLTPEPSASAGRDVAIIGLSGRYPQASNVEQYWENLRAGKNCIVEIPPERWSLEGFYCEDLEQAISTGRSYCKWGGFVDGFADFDPLFFNISPREAEGMDPQERLFMQSCWEVMEDAGYTRETLASRHGGRVGVFAGITKTGFDLYGPEFWRRGEVAFPRTSFSSVANRVSYFMNLNGPSLPIDTMCSASLTAIHEACEHLLRDECELAIAGGVNLYLHPSNYILLCLGRMLSRQGQCRSFGRGGDGMAPGEGVGTVLLKRLSQAEADGDHIYGVIKGSSINHGGKTNGYTVPNPTAQKEVIRGAISRAGVDARAISYIEAHGTGTELGDPIEIAGLTQAFREYTTDQQFCAIGSAKSNIGHCESAAGIAGLTKVLMQMKYGQLAPSLHTEDLNPNIDFEKTPFVVQRELGEWKRPRITVAGGTRERPRMAGISSFGAGGANAHVIVEEYVAVNDHRHTTTVGERQSLIIVLSAKTEDQLKSQARNLVSAIHARRLTDADLPSIAYTLQAGREAMEERAAVIVNTTKELEEKLQAFVESRAEIGEVYRGQVRHGRESLTLFVGDEEFGETIDKWIQRGKLGKLADLWVKGFDIDWNKMYTERKPRRISLPTYPFAREHYWLPVIVEGNQTENGYNCGNADSKRSDTSVHENIPGRSAPELSALLRYVEEWKPRADADIPVGDRPIQLIHFTEDEQLSSALARLLEGRHDQSRLIRVVKGSQFRRLSSTLYELPAEGEDGFRALWDSLSSAEKHHGAGDWAALYSWGEGLSKIQGLHSLLKTGLRSCLELKRLIITGTALDDLGSCYDLSLIGYERSLGSVAPQLSVTILYGDEEGVRAEQIWQNLWRAGVRRFQGGSSYELGYRETSGAAAARPALRKQGVYLITGGGGGLGKLFAGHLAQAYQARLALVGRSPVDEEKQEQLRRLKSSGAQDAAYYSADVCDRERMREVVAEVKERWGEINGIIHCAGLESRKPLMEKEWEEFRGILSPKVEGTRALDEVTAEVELDFVCYFSSSAAILGDVGGCDYAIGNRYQMAYGAYRERERERGKRRGQTLVMNWPLWREGGMGEVGSEPIEMYLKSSGQRYLERAEGIEAWEDALGREARQEMILVGQPARVERFLFRIYSGRHEESLAPSSRSVNRQNGARSRSGAQGPAPDSATLRRRVVDGLKERIGELLKIKQGQLNEKTNFADFGFDSIGLAQFSRVLTALYGFEVGPNVFFNYSTVERLSEHLIERHRPALEALYRPERGDEAIENPELGKAPREAEQRRVAARSGVGAESRLDEPIAIIGMSGRFPGADNVEELWELLSSGRKAITEIPRERWDWREYYRSPGAVENRIATNKGGFIRGLDEFDPLFFEISPKEAEWMDPRQRLILQEAWRAFEDAGCAGERIRGSSCGVFIGAEEVFYGNAEGSQGVMTSSHNAILAARISYFLDLQGPNLAINTACSSGLVAVHYACQSLRRGECELALAGGVNILTSALTYVALSQNGMLSKDGECYAFDNRANGLTPGEAVAVVVLKPLWKAEEDGDAIYGVIRGSGVNYHGKTNGITAPSALSQARLVESVLRQSQVSAESVQYVLAHSVGSQLGDPIEAQALSEAFRKYTDESEFCAIGSIKPLIGHTFAASGVVSLIGMCLAIRHRMMPASGNYRKANEYIDFKSSPFYVNEENRDWRIVDEACPRRGIVGATGMSGTNAFALIDEYIPEIGRRQTAAENLNGAGKGDQEPEEVLIVLSAKSDSALREYANNLKRQLSSRRDLNLLDAAYTLQTGREPMDCRLAIVASSKDSLIDKLNTYLNGPDEDSLRLNAIYTAKQKAAAGGLHNSASNGNSTTGRLSASSDPHKLDDLAARWVCGANVDWNALYAGRTVKRVPLTSYPFERNSCSNGHGIPATERPDADVLNGGVKCLNDAHDEGADQIIKIISSYSKVDVKRIDLISPISSLGIDSLMMMNMISSIEELYSIDLSLEEIISCESIARFCEMVSNKKRSAGARREPNKYREFEILQSNGELAPAFWFHGSLGTIQGYVGLSQHIGKTLPFYAIQSRGIKGSDKPIDNLIEMASYYVEMLLARGGVGNIPFQLGGYSEGGLIAYEVARQLQLRGHDVKNIIMIDAPYPYNSSPLSNDAGTIKLRYAMVYTNILMMNNLGGFADINALRLENVSVENVVPYLVNAGMEKGLKYSSQELQAILDQYYKIAEANERAAESYVMEGLPRPGAVECHYFQRKSRGVYFHPKRFEMPIVEQVNRYYRNKRCADKWRRRLPNFNHYLTTASDHFSLLSEKEPFELILGACRKLYQVQLPHVPKE